MKLHHLLLAAGALAFGWYAALASQAGNSSAHSVTAMPNGDVAYYQSPMHPWIKSAHPGKCTICGMDLVPVYLGSAEYENSAAGEVMLPPTSVRATGIQTSPVQRAVLSRALHFAGRFEEDAMSHAVISAPVEGRIDGLGLVHGNGKVVQRQPLANIFSRTLLAAAEEYKRALPQGEAAAAETRRVLEQDGLVWEQIKAIPLRQENDLYFGLLSPRSGRVVKSYVSEGQYVRAGDKLFEITDPIRLWFMFPAYEQDLVYLEVNEMVTIETGSQTVRGRLVSIGQQVDEATHTVDVRVEVENPEGALRLGEDGRGTILLQSPDVLSIPRSAVLWPSGSPRVYVEESPGIYTPKTIQLGRAGDDTWEVRAGLTENMRVVTAGNVLLDGQAELNQLGPIAGN